MSIPDHMIQWQGMAISIRHVANWSNTGFAHLEIQSIDPIRAALPITETGYRSHFLHTSEIEERGGAVAYVIAWLDHDAQSKAWKNIKAASEQLSLF